MKVGDFCFDFVGEAEGSGGGVAWLFDISLWSGFFVVCPEVNVVPDML